MTRSAEKPNLSTSAFAVPVVHFLNFCSCSGSPATPRRISALESAKATVAANRRQERSKPAAERRKMVAFGAFRTPEACSDISQVYAVFAYTWSLPESRDRTLKGCRGFLAPLPGCVCLVAFSLQGYAKNAYPWLSSQHRSAVRTGQTSADLSAVRKRIPHTVMPDLFSFSRTTHHRRTCIRA